MAGLGELLRQGFISAATKTPLSQVRDHDTSRRLIEELRGQLSAGGDISQSPQLRDLSAISPEKAAAISKSFNDNEDFKIKRTFSDAQVALELGKDNPQAAIDMLKARARSVKLGGGDNSDTLDLINMFESGDVEGAFDDLIKTVKLGQAQGYLQKPSGPEILKNNQLTESGQVISRNPDGSISAQNIGGFKQAPAKPDTELAKLFALSDTLPPGDPRRGQINARIEKLTQKGSPALEQLALIQAQLATTERQDKIDRGRREDAKAEKTERKSERAARSLLTLGRELLSDKSGVEAISGASGMVPTVKPSTKSFQAKLGRLLSALTLENTDRLTGILSDTDIKLLENSASAVTEGGTFEGNIGELSRIVGTLEEALGEESRPSTTKKRRRGDRESIINEARAFLENE